MYRLVTLGGLLLAAALFTFFPPASVAQEADNDLAALIIGFLQDSDKDVRALALEQIRTSANGAEMTKRFASQLPELQPATQAELVRALAQRGDRAARPAIVELLEKTRDPTVRISAIEALGAVGDREDIDSLIRILQSADRAEQTAAAKSLIRLEGGDVSREITQVMNGADSKLRVQLIEILAQRRAFESVEELLNAARDQEATVRQAAMKALGKLATPEQVGGMIQGVLAAEPGAERGAAEKQVMIVANRIEDPQQRAAPILAAMKRMDRQDRLAILSVLGRVGGSEARQVIEQEIANRDALRHSAGIRAIANWPTAEIAPRLFELAERDPHRSHRITALRAAIRVAPLPDERSDAQRLALLKKAMEMATRDAERILILDRSRAVRIPETLRFVLPYVGKPPLSEQACLTVVELAHHRELREANKAEFHRALDKVIAATKDPVIIDRANRYKRNQTWVRPK